MKKKRSDLAELQKDNIDAAIEGTEAIGKAMVDSTAKVSSALLDTTRKTMKRSTRNIKAASRKVSKN